ncbi:MAG: competence type IV pilus minor pilin ComGD [Paenisporosarcina sp.]
MNNNRGYTLLEVLLVLSMVAIMTMCVIFISNSYLEKKAFLLFMNQFKLDVYHMQNYSIEKNTQTELVFGNKGTTYTTRKSFFEPIIQRSLPKGIKLSTKSTLTSIAFNPNGSIVNFGTLTFETPDDVKMVRIYIGKGKMTVEE